MWILKGLIFLAFIFALVFFVLANSQQPVDINFFGKSYLGVSMYWVVVVSYLLGFATSFVLAAFREFQHQRKIGQLQRQVRAKDKEIADLRTLPLKQNPAEPKTDRKASGE